MQRILKVKPVSVISDISPIFKANAASWTKIKFTNNEKNVFASNGFCIVFLPNAPKSPPRLADEQSLKPNFIVFST